ncbi:DUF1576 domain-containing protein [uncultured Fusobacterium sp.]|uniref:DUF1576 domain-containing protein n=1 Tax=uncultured Fusobacterium sp. TaxID=159267 RepID=UPI0025D138CB|nr:DUF1576 domain-containing protein [uncultured Fusobacterium sp.]
MDNFNKSRLKKIEFISILLISSIIIGFSCYVFHERENVLTGILKIITSQAILITDFLVIGGIGAAFLNAFLIFLFNFTLSRLLKVEITGLVVASFFTVFGFSFFGKNILNILPFYLGGILYSVFEHIDFKEIFVSVSFTSALAPFVSEVAFRVDTTDTSYINAIALGIIIGFISTPLAKKMASFHEGFNLYNLGFTGGILGAVITSILKLYNFPITPQRIISTEFDLALKIICASIFSTLIIIGFFINESSFKGYGEILKDSGLKSDFIKKYGFGLTFINMGIMGFVATGFVILIGETLNGPLLAGILTVVGFSAYGKHFKNTIPILVGVYLAGWGSSTNGFTIALSALFGTSLAPVAGVYGFVWGIIAGWLHLAVVQSIGTVHGGLNLYNNGFSAGIVASFLLPIMDMIKDHKDKERIKYLKRKKELYDAITEQRRKMEELDKDL